MHNNLSRLAICSLLAASMLTLGMPEAQARLEAKGKARTSVGRVSPASAKRPDVQRPAHRDHQLKPRDHADHNRNRNRRDININNRHDIDINVDRGGGWGHHHHDRWDDDDDWDVGKTIATTAAIAATASIIGTIIRANQLPSNCVQINHRGGSYLQCGNTWYQPQYNGPDITYVVVNAPY